MEELEGILALSRRYGMRGVCARMLCAAWHGQQGEARTTTHSIARCWQGELTWLAGWWLLLLLLQGTP